MDKFLLFNEQGTAGSVGDAANDVVCYPLSKFKGFGHTASDTTLTMIFEGMLEGTADGDASSVDTITLTITQNKHVEAMTEIANAIGSNISGTIVIADKGGSETYVSSYITNVSIAISAAD